MDESDIHLKLVNSERLTKRLDGVFTRENEEERLTAKPRWSKHFHASTLADCLRKNAYSQLKVAPARSIGRRSWQLSATIGTLIHDQLQSDMKDVEDLLYIHPGFGPAIELPLEKAVDPDMADEFAACNISGRIDMIFDLGGRLFIGDIKTTDKDDMRSLDKMQGFEREMMLSKLHHWQTQLLLYLHFFRAPDGRKADIGIIYQVDRGSPQDRKQWQLDYSEELIRPELERLKEANQYVQRGELPPPEPDRGPCGFCAYKTVCPAWDGNKRVYTQEELEEAQRKKIERELTNQDAIDDGYHS